MEAALYDPKSGYYGAGRASIGRQGDFFTNVSVGALFGRLLARQFAEMWTRLGKPNEFTIIEQGAHGGEFAADALAGLRDFANECYQCTRYVIVEPSEALRQMQAAKLADFGPDRVQWRDSLEALEPCEGVHFSNELVDAFPVHRIRRSGATWVEQHVEWRDNRFSMVEGPISQEVIESHPAILDLPMPDCYETEVNLGANAWIETLSPKLVRGWVLLIDYGYPREEYYRPERSTGTLSGYAKHQRVTDLLDRPGEIDLTAHVDFTNLAEAAEKQGWKTAGFTDQHHFMVGLSRLHFSDATALTPAMEKELRAFKTLMHPNMMGTSFKALCLEKGIPAASQEGSLASSSVPLAGFVFGGNPRTHLGL